MIVCDYCGVSARRKAVSSVTISVCFHGDSTPINCDTLHLCTECREKYQRDVGTITYFYKTKSDKIG